MQDKIYQRAGGRLVPVNIGASPVQPGCLAVEDGSLVMDTDKTGNMTFTVSDGYLEADNG